MIICKGTSNKYPSAKGASEGHESFRANPRKGDERERVGNVTTSLSEDPNSKVLRSIDKHLEKTSASKQGSTRPPSSHTYTHINKYACQGAAIGMNTQSASARNRECSISTPATRPPQATYKGIHQREATNCATVRQSPVGEYPRVFLRLDTVGGTLSKSLRVAIVPPELLHGALCAV